MLRKFCDKNITLCAHMQKALVSIAAGGPPVLDGALRACFCLISFCRNVTKGHAADGLDVPVAPQQDDPTAFRHLFKASTEVQDLVDAWNKNGYLHLDDWREHSDSPQTFKERCKNAWMTQCVHFFG